MSKTYLLVHIYKSGEEDAQHKLIGVYSSEENAQLAADQSKTLPGFRDWPNAFIIYEFQLNKLYDDDVTLKFSP